MTPTRRELFQLLGAGALVLGAGCSDTPTVATAALDPREDSVVVAIWSQRSNVATSVTATRGGIPVGQVRGALTGQLGMLEVTGLASGTTYELTISVGGVAVATHRVRTAPSASDRSPVRIGVVADCDPNPMFANGTAEQLAQLAPDLVLSIGDFPYTDDGPPAMTVDEYRARHAELRGHPPVRALLESSGLASIYDDHEYMNDWDAGRAAAEPERYAAALQVWDEFFPQRSLADAGPIRYRNWRWGAQLECFLLDCRRFRSTNAAPDNADKVMIGAIQRAWLADAVARSTATFKLILTSIPLDFGNGDDHWAAYTTERDAMFAQLAGIPGVLFMSGDQHWFAAHRHAYGIREIQIGPLARGFGMPQGAPAGVLYRAVRYNAGLVEIADDRLTVTGLGENGERFYTETLSAADLTPRLATTG